MNKLDEREKGMNERADSFSVLMFVAGLVLLLLLMVCGVIERLKPTPVQENFYEITDIDGKTYIKDHGIWGGLKEYEH